MAPIVYAWLRPVEAALGLVDVGRGDRRCARPRASGRRRQSAVGLACTRIAGFWPPLMLTSPTPGSCEIFWASRVSARSCDLATAAASSRSAPASGSARRPDWSCCRSAGSADRAAGRSPAALIAACTCCSATSMSSSSANCSVMTEQPSELVDVICVRPGHLAELALERRRDRRRHHVRARARIERHDLDRRIVDLRQRRDRQLPIGDRSRSRSADHQERGRDRPQDEGPRDVHAGGSFSAQRPPRSRTVAATTSSGPQLVDAVDHHLLAGGEAARRSRPRRRPPARARPAAPRRSGRP